jgi:gamma-glutamylcyclotransferase (GGCT)/AIG2-like uncharacterized protein YtfP
MIHRLFVYGSLQPGGPNEHVLQPLDGDWIPGSIRGRLLESGWGSALGFPGLVIDDSADLIWGHVIASPGLADLWTELDAFEGTEYARVTASVTLQSGEQVQAQVYVLATWATPGACCPPARRS